MNIFPISNGQQSHPSDNYSHGLQIVLLAIVMFSKLHYLNYKNRTSNTFNIITDQHTVSGIIIGRHIILSRYVFQIQMNFYTNMICIFIAILSCRQKNFLNA